AAMVISRTVALCAACGVLVPKSTSTYCEFVFTSVTVTDQVFVTFVVPVSKISAGAALATRLAGSAAEKRQLVPFVFCRPAQTFSVSGRRLLTRPPSVVAVTLVGKNHTGAAGGVAFWGARGSNTLAESRAGLGRVVAGLEPGGTDAGGRTVEGVIAVLGLVGGGRG